VPAFGDRHRSMRRFAAALGLSTLFVARAQPAPDAAQPFWASILRPGRYSVGAAVIAARDSARPTASGAARPVQIVVWYPARGRQGVPLTYGDYYALMASDTGSTADTIAIGRSDRVGLTKFLGTRGVTDSVVARWFAAPMAGRRQATEAGGRFPLLLIAQGNDESAHDQAVLAEYLASFGYVVATSPSPTRITGPLTDTAAVGQRAEEQADDLEFIMRQMRGRRDVDGSRVGVVAHSFGARGALLLAMRHPEVVKAIVSLDGGIGTATGRRNLEASRSFDAHRATASVLHFDETLDAFMAPDDGLLRELAGPVWLVHTTGLHHHHFTTLAPSGAAFATLGAATGATAGTAVAYATVAQLARSFLDDRVKGRPASFATACAESARSTPRGSAAFRCERL